MFTSTITAQGRTTVPKGVREHFDAMPGVRLVWHVLPDGSVLVRAKNKSILDLAGSLKVPGDRRVRVEDMNPWG